MRTCREVSVGSESCHFNDKGATICTDNDTNNVARAMSHTATLHRRGLINVYLHVEINQCGNCAKPVPISSGFFIPGFCMMGLLCYDKLHFPCQTAMEIDLGKTFSNLLSFSPDNLEYWSPLSWKTWRVRGSYVVLHSKIHVLLTDHTLWVRVSVSAECPVASVVFQVESYQ